MQTMNVNIVVGNWAANDKAGRRGDVRPVARDIVDW